MTGRLLYLSLLCLVGTPVQASNLCEQFYEIAQQWMFFDNPGDSVLIKTPHITIQGAVLPEEAIPKDETTRIFFLGRMQRAIGTTTGKVVEVLSPRKNPDLGRGSPLQTDGFAAWLPQFVIDRVAPSALSIFRRYPKWASRCGFAAEKGKFYLGDEKWINHHVDQHAGTDLELPFRVRDYGPETVEKWSGNSALYKYSALEFAIAISNRIVLVGRDSWMFLHDRNHLIGAMLITDLVFSRFQKKADFLAKAYALVRDPATKELIASQLSTLSSLWDSASEQLLGSFEVFSSRPSTSTMRAAFADLAGEYASERMPAEFVSSKSLAQGILAQMADNTASQSDRITLRQLGEDCFLQPLSDVALSLEVQQSIFLLKKR